MENKGITLGRGAVLGEENVEIVVVSGDGMVDISELHQVVSVKEEARGRPLFNRG